MLWSDNQNAGDLARNHVFRSSKSIELGIHYIRDKVLGQQLVVRLLTSSQKILSLPKFNYLTSNINLVSRPLSLRGDVKEAYLCSITENHNNVSKVTNKAKDHNSFYSQL